MALSAPNKAMLYEIIGLPMSGLATIFYRTLSLYGPASTTYNCSALVTSLEATLTALLTDQETRITNLLTQWDANKLSYSEVEVYQDGGTTGVLSNTDKQRQKIRASLDAILQIGIPPEGFLEAMKAQLIGGGGRVVK